MTTPRGRASILVPTPTHRPVTSPRHSLLGVTVRDGVTVTGGHRASRVTAGVTSDKPGVYGPAIARVGAWCRVRCVEEVS